MPSIRRYGPSMVTPQISPRPELGQGREKSFEAFGKVLGSAQEFIRPAVVATRTAQGERDSLEQINNDTFEPRQPFTVYDQAFNASADRVIGARAQGALEEGMRAAQIKANGNVGVLRVEMERTRQEIIGSLPVELPGLATEIQANFDRGKLAAERQAIQLAQRRVVQQQRSALDASITATRLEADRLALTGATAEELADHLAQSTEALAQFGPRGEFEVAGQVFAPDASRAGTVTQARITAEMADIAEDTSRLMIEADFMRSEAPGQYVAEFRRQVFAGNSPLPAGESLEVLRSMEGRARTTESARLRASNAERLILEKGMTDTINGYVQMGEAGVPVAIPQEERAGIINNLSPHPDLQRRALTEFAVADAQVATHGMTGTELMSYVSSVRADMTAAVERGELDLQGAAIIESLQDQIKRVRDAVSAETVGLPVIEQLIRDGGTADDVDYDAMRENAAGNQDVINAIAEVEAFHRDAETFSGMSAEEREVALEGARASLTVLAAQAKGYGSHALTTGAVMDRLEAWSDHRQALASSDPVAFAQSVGVVLPGFGDAENMAQLGALIGVRVLLLAPASRAEGVDNPVPLTQAEIDGISEVFEGSSRSERAEFLASVSALGEDQAMAIFSRVGQSEPVIFAAGSVYANGNQQAAGVILRGAVDTKLQGGGPIEQSAAREVSLGPLLELDMLAPEGLADLDVTALAYARGLAMAAGGRIIEQGDIEAGYQVALGRQADGTGGIVETSYGTTILPAGWNRARLNQAIFFMTEQQLTDHAKGLVVDRLGRRFSVASLLDNIEQLKPSSEDPTILIPLDADGAAFGTDNGGERGILTFDLKEMD